jgi:hypothetical protein
MWNIILMMVEAFDTNQKEKGGEEKKSKKLLKMFICHIIIVPVSFYSFSSVLSTKGSPFSIFQWSFGINITNCYVY